jgi:undecaprenyl-diphosphatase
VEIWDYLLLGAVQGLTEFLPVSSSGHLVLLEHWLDLNPPGVVLEVALHIATLLSVLVVYRRDITRLWREGNWRYLGFIVLATAVTVAIALPFKQVVADLTDSGTAVRFVGIMLFITAAWLLLADWRLRRNKVERPLGWPASLLAGIAQALAVLPGISRSGATIGLLIQTGQGRREAARFSFLLSVPVILGAGLLSIGDLSEGLAQGHINGPGLGLAFVAALVFGIAAIHLVLAALHRARLSLFALYCIALGAVAVAVG